MKILLNDLPLPQWPLMAVLTPAELALVCGGAAYATSVVANLEPEPPFPTKLMANIEVDPPFPTK